MAVYRNQNWLPNIFNDLFDDANTVANTVASTSMANLYNVKETNGEYLVEFAVPGLKKEDVALKLDKDDHLVISVGKVHQASKGIENKASACASNAHGENCKHVAHEENAAAKGVENPATKSSENGAKLVKERYLRQNFCYPRFEKVFSLPEDANLKAIGAHVVDGILTIVLPKYTPEDIQKAERQITIA